MEQPFKATRTKTGQFIHRQFKGCAYAFCGSKAPIQVRGKVPAKRCCEKCWGSNPTAFSDRTDCVEIVS